MGGKRKSKPKKKTKAQKMAVANKAKYGGTAKAAAANKASMKNKAKSYTKSYGAASVAAANKAANKVAAGKRYQTSQANKALSKAGGTSAQVAKDNKQYGNTVPAGSFNISEKGKAEAAANLAARTAPEGAFGISEKGKKVAAAQLQEKRAADKELAPSRLLSGVKNAFTSENLSSGDLRNPLNAPNYLAAAGAGYTDAVIGGVNFAKNLIPGAKQLPNIPTLPKYADKNLQNVRNISAVGIPLAQGFGAAKRFMSVDPVSGKAGFANEIAKMTVSDAAFKAGKVPQLTKTGITNINPGTIAKAFTPQMVATGPTAGASLALSGAMLGGQASTKAGGLNIGGGVDSGEDPKSNTGRTLGSKALGAVDAVFGTDLDNLGGRTTPFGESLTSSINAFNTANQNIGELTGSTNPVKNLAGSLMLGKNVSMEDLASATTAAKTFKEEGLTEGLKSLNPQTTESIGDVYNALEAGRLTNPLTGNDVYKQAMTNFGGESFQSKINEGVNYFTEKYGQLTDNEKENRKVVSDMLVADDPRLDSLKALGYQMKENPKLGIQEQVKNALKPNAPQLPGVNKDDLGIMGSLGNFILSNQGKSIVTGNLPGTNNALDLASNIVKTGSDPTSDTYKKSQAFLRTIDKGTPTPGSIIKGVIPRIGGSRGSTPVGQVRSGGSLPSVAAAALQQQQQQQPVEEIPLPTNADRPNLRDITQRAYNRQMRIYGAPNYTAQFRPIQRVRPLKRREYFNRDHIPKLLKQFA